MVLIPNIIEKSISGEKIYDIYTKLLSSRIIFLNGEIDDNMAGLIISELLYLDSLNHEDIFIYISSPGGSVTSGMSIFDTMNYIKCDVSTLCMGVSTVACGMCASMAAIILANGAKGKRLILPNSEVMIHQVLGGTQGQATEIKIQAERILNLKKKLNGILANLTGQSIKKIDNDTERDHYLSSSEALEYGIVDKVLN